MTYTAALQALREIDPAELPIFAHLLMRVSRFASLSNHAYGAMSGFALDDQKKLYNTLGLQRMLSFDPDEHVVSRQRFNKPGRDGRTTIATFEQFAADWPQIFAEEGIEDVDNYILWVRRQSSEEIGQGVGYFQQMVGALPENGIARITLQIDYEAWAGPLFDGGRRLAVVERRDEVRRKVAEHLADHLSTGDLASAMDEDGLQRVLAKAYGNAAATAIGTSTGITFEPLSVVAYGTGISSLTLTGMVVDTLKRETLRELIDEDGWPFASPTWADVNLVRLPDLTLRERFELEAARGDRTSALGRLHFDLDAATGGTGLFDSFARYHRFFPAMVAAEL